MALYVQSSIQTSIWPSPLTDNRPFELLWVYALVPCSLFVAALYHPPRPLYSTADPLSYIENCVAELSPTIRLRTSYWPVITTNCMTTLSSARRSPALSLSYLGSPTLVETALSFTVVLSFFFAVTRTAFSRRAEYGHQMCIGGSVVGEASTICPESSPTPPLILQGVKSAKFGVAQL